MQKDLILALLSFPPGMYIFLFAPGFVTLYKSATLFPSVCQVLASGVGGESLLLNFLQDLTLDSFTVSQSFASQKRLGLSVKQNTKSVFITRTVVVVEQCTI